MHVEESAAFDRPVQEVFDYLADPTNLPEWSGAAVEVRDIRLASPGKLGEGDTFRPVHLVLGRRIEEHVEVTAFEPNRRILHRSAGGPMPLVVSYIDHEPDEGNLDHMEPHEPSPLRYRVGDATRLGMEDLPKGEGQRGAEQDETAQERVISDRYLIHEYAPRILHCHPGTTFLSQTTLRGALA